MQNLSLILTPMAQATRATPWAASSDIASQCRCTSATTRSKVVQQSMHVCTEVLRIHCTTTARLKEGRRHRRSTSGIYVNLHIIAGLQIWQSSTLGTQWRRRLCLTASCLRRRAFGGQLCGLEAWAAKGISLDCDGEERCWITSPSGIGIKTCCTAFVQPLCSCCSLRVTHVRDASSEILKVTPTTLLCNGVITKPAWTSST